jgi:hypothetical protein
MTVPGVIATLEASATLEAPVAPDEHGKEPMLAAAQRGPATRALEKGWLHLERGPEPFQARVRAGLAGGRQ